MMDAETLKAMKDVATDAIKILGPASIAAIVAFRTARSQLAVEKLRLHDKDRTLAHKKLFTLAKRIENATFPMAENKDTDFREIMRNEYMEGVQMDLIYFSDEVAQILERFEEKFICMTRGELAGDTEDGVTSFLEKQAFGDARRLGTLARAAMREVQAG